MTEPLDAICAGANPTPASKACDALSQKADRCRSPAQEWAANCTFSHFFCRFIAVA
ncbi:hypothetical protein [Klebsiella quasipneumoniae]|uniref:hypothetical protein n=1 Tax=Klebsiella quasipneumoniae TaxID=1463165 RepID=UPI003709B9C7